jgi:hypothetical protein
LSLAEEAPTGTTEMRLLKNTALAILGNLSSYNPEDVHRHGIFDCAPYAACYWGCVGGGGGMYGCGVYCSQHYGCGSFPAQ